MNEHDTTAETPAAPGAIAPGALGTAIGGAADAPAETPAPRREPKPADAHGWWWGTGRRKAAVARVRMRPAADKGGVRIQITGKKFKNVDEYFSEMRDRGDATAPLELTNTADKLDVIVRLHGGGTMGQAQAMRLGIARALVGYDPATEDALRDSGFLTRDARKVERKKYGQPGARRRFQFSKR